MTPPPEPMKAESPGKHRCGRVKVVRLRSMPVPYLIAAKAGTVIGMARSALAEWNRLDVETKRHLQREASDVRERLFEVAAALGARLRDSKDEGLSWGDARNLALTPRADFVLAREIPAILLSAPDIDDSGLASRLGNPVLQVVESALAIAEADGFIEHADGRWRVTEFGDQALAESDDVALMEAAITERLRRVGLAARDELAVGVGCVDSAEPGFLDALERALAAGNVEWLGPATYGLPAEQLAAMDPPDEEAGGGRSRTRDLKDLVVDLGQEVNELRVAVAQARGKAESPLADSSSRSHGGHARSRKLAAKAVAAGFRRYADHRAPSTQAGAQPRPAQDGRTSAEANRAREKEASGAGKPKTRHQPADSRAMPAVCEIGGCGVPAIGRCASCDLAFCATHQGRDSIRTKYIDFCSACVEDQAATGRAQMQRRLPAYDPALLPTIAATMYEAGVGGLEERSFRWRTVTSGKRALGWRRSGTDRIAREFVGAPAWSVGFLSLRESKSTYVTEERVCGVTPAGALVLMPAEMLLGETEPTRLQGEIVGPGRRQSPVIARVESGIDEPELLDADLLSLDGENGVFVALGRESPRVAARALDIVAARHGLDLALKLGWSDDLTLEIRRAGA